MRVLAPRSMVAGRGRLTDVERAERRMTGGELQRLIVGDLTNPGLAPVLGWEWLHVVPGIRTKGRWWTATTGTLSHWPDLTLVRERGRRLIFAEIKRELEQLTPEQARVLDVLRTLTFPNCSCRAGRGEPLENWQLFGSEEVDGVRHDPGCRLLGGGVRGTDPQIEIHVWRPSDLRDPIETSRIYEVLR